MLPLQWTVGPPQELTDALSSLSTFFAPVTDQRLYLKLEDGERSRYSGPRGIVDKAIFGPMLGLLLSRGRMKGMCALCRRLTAKLRSKKAKL